VYFSVYKLVESSSLIFKTALKGMEMFSFMKTELDTHLRKTTLRNVPQLYAFCLRCL